MLLSCVAVHRATQQRPSAMRWALALSLAMLSALAQAAKFDDIAELTPFNFHEHVGQKNVLREGGCRCGGCKKFIPQYEELHQDLSAVSDKVSVMKANVTMFEYEELKGRLNVSRVPAVRYFAKDDGPEATPSVVVPNEAWKMGFAIKGKLGLPTPNKCMFGDSEARDVSNKDWGKYVDDPSHTVLVEFYAPWCGHCKKFKTTYNLIAARLRRMKSSKLAAYRVNADLSKDLMSKFNVKRLPSFFVFPRDNKTGTPFQMNMDGTSTDTVEHVVKYMLRNETLERKANALLEQLNALVSTQKDTTAAMKLVLKQQAELSKTDVWSQKLGPQLMVYKEEHATRMKAQALELVAKQDHKGALTLLAQLRDEYGDTEVGKSEAITNIYENVVHTMRH